MTVFWVVTGAMAAAVAGLLALSLLRGQRETGPAEAFDLAVYRDQLKEIDRDLARGVIPASEADRLRTEVSRRILAADAEARADAGSRTDQPALPTYAAAGLSAALVVGLAFYVYLQIGTPGYPDLPLQARIAAAEDARESRPSQAEAEAGMPAQTDPNVPEDYLALVERLRSTVADRPGDLQGNVLLARSEAALGNYVAAYKAQERVVGLKGEEAAASDFADLADMMVLAAGGYVSPEAQAALEEALARDPQNGVARYYAGLMMAQTGRPDLAFRTWDRLLVESPADAPWVPPVRAQIEEMAWRAGIADYTLPEARDAPGPTREQMEAAADLTPEERMEMIRGMVDGLSARLANQGGPAEDWARLINALGVLGDEERARAIWQEAQAVFAEAPQEDRDMLRAAAENAGLAE